ncbi:MAG: hypothetical protein U0X20_23390 [Caldilineaceae bacterium]
MTIRAWPEHLIAIMRMLAMNLGAAIAWRQMQDQLTEQERFMGTVLDAVPAMIGVRDEYGRLDLVNQTLADLAGQDPAVFIGQPADSNSVADTYFSGIAFRPAKTGAGTALRHCRRCRRAVVVDSRKAA